MAHFNDRLRQVLLLALIILLGILLYQELHGFLPGLLGAVTLFILTKDLYFRFTIIKGWKKGLTALLFILAAILLIAVPVTFIILMVSPKINHIIANPEPILQMVKHVAQRIQDITGSDLATPENIQAVTNKITGIIPGLLNSTASLLTNLVMMFFLLYFMLYNGREIEKYLEKVTPLKRENVSRLGRETQMMIRANALGIPLISIIQGITAAIGYWIFGVQEWALWGLITGLFAFFPVVGTMLIWVPVCISLYASGAVLPSFGLTVYSLLVTGNIDYVARLSLMKRMGDVHPVVTVMGVIVGLGAFGFMGLIFGPLLVSYFIILVKIYMNEFGNSRDAEESA